MVPEPKIVIAAMKACRKLNDYALAVRYLEAVQVKFTIVTHRGCIMLKDPLAFVIPKE